MAAIEIIVGSVLGASEYVADALAETLQQKGHSANIHLEPKLAEIPKEHIWLLCSSTHGAGDLPDNIQPFADELETADVNSVHYALVGLGDSSYDTFCGGAEQLQRLMANAQMLVPMKTIDVLQHPIPEDIAVEWLHTWVNNI